MTSQLKCRVGGLTLLELLVVIAIISITAVVAIPSLQPLTSNTDARRITEELRQDLMFARSSALTSGTLVTIDPVELNDWNAGWTIFSQDGELRTKSVVSDNNEIQSQLLTDDGAALLDAFSFDERGRINAGGTVVFTISVEGCTGNNITSLIINPVGQIIAQGAACED